MKPPQQPLADYMADAPVTSEPTCNPLIEDKLSQSQMQVLQAIMAGKSISAAAASAGVSRSSVYRWQNDDANYIAALNAWKQQTEDSVRHRLLAMADRAVIAINNALLTCDARVGFALLKGMGLLAPPQKSSADPAIVAKQLQLKREKIACHQAEQAQKLRKRARWAQD
jgi:DNA-binding phage protein